MMSSLPPTVPTPEEGTAKKKARATTKKKSADAPTAKGKKPSKRKAPDTPDGGGGDDAAATPRKRGRKSKKTDAPQPASDMPAPQPIEATPAETTQQQQQQQQQQPVANAADMSSLSDAPVIQQQKTAAASTGRNSAQRALSLNRLYGDPAQPDSREFMHVIMGHALMREDDVFYLHPLSEHCIVRRGEVPCPDPSRSTTYRNAFRIETPWPCMHCDRECKAGRVPLPRAYDQRTCAYSVWGNFCSFPCAMAYQLERGSGVYDTPTVLMLIQKMASEVWRRPGLVRPAPPRFLLRKFGGHVDPDDIEALSEHQIYSIAEAPFISWAMMVECKTVDAVDGATKRLLAGDVPKSAGGDDAARQPSPPLLPTTYAFSSVGPLAIAAGDATAPTRSFMAALANEETRETDAEAHARIERAWQLRGLPPHDPNMEHPGALCREGGIVGIKASAGLHDAQQRAERGISLLGHAPAPILPSGADSVAAAAASGESLWERFIKNKNAAGAR